MSNALKAAGDIRKLAKLYESMAAAADALDKIGSLEQAENEANVRIAKLNADAAQIASENAEARRVALAIVDTANDDAEAARKSADDYAAELIASAKADCASQVEAASKATATAKDKVKRAEEKLQAISADVDAKAGELAALEEKIVEARANIAKLLGS